MDVKEKVKTWILIPARGGSKGITAKNIRLLGDKPLIRYILDTLSEIVSAADVIVSTDDDNIAHIAKPFAQIHHRSVHTASDHATLDDVALEVAQWLVQNGAKPTDFLITIQPTSPFLEAKHIQQAIQFLEEGAASILSVKDDRHLQWTLDDAGNAVPLFEKRVNRQWLPPRFTETGGIIGTRLDKIIKTGTRIHQPIALLELDAREGLDIDSFADWKVAEYYVHQKRIIIRADAGKLLGMGHVHRALALAQELASHHLCLVTRHDEGFELGATFLAAKPYRLQTVPSEEEFFNFLEGFHPDIVILDILDTEASYVKKLKAQVPVVISFEDLGSGSQEADVVINDLYTDFYPQKNHWYGVENAILASHFEHFSPKVLNPTVGQILITYGGTDPQNLTQKALKALQKLKYQGEVTVVLGPGYAHELPELDTYQLSGTILQSVKNMALVMHTAELAITSAGRTVTELMTLGIPTLVACQNMRELRHTHASGPFGIINLGLGEFLSIEMLAHHIRILLENFTLRQDMQKRALTAVQYRSNHNIVLRLLEAVSEKV